VVDVTSAPAWLVQVLTPLLLLLLRVLIYWSGSPVVGEG